MVWRFHWPFLDRRLEATRIIGCVEEGLFEASGRDFGYVKGCCVVHVKEQEGFAIIVNVDDLDESPILKKSD